MEDNEPIFTKYSPETAAEQMFNIFEEIPKPRILAHQRALFSAIGLPFSDPWLDSILNSGEYSSKEKELEKRIFTPTPKFVENAEKLIKNLAEMFPEKLHHIYVNLQQSDLVKPLQYRRIR